MKKNFFQENNFRNNRGYTLLEVVLVMAFTSISFMALYGIFARTIQGDTESQYEIIASNLAQECIERVRNCRDNKVLNNSSWDISSLKSDCASAADSILSFSSGGRDFNTSLSITNDGGEEEEEVVTCTTSWNSFLIGGNRSVTIKSLLTNWQKQGT